MVLQSMTGCGKKQLRIDGWEISAEIRSVNHRFLDIACRLPRNLAFLEPVVRECLSACLRRGHVEVYLSVKPEASSQGQLTLDESLAADYQAAALRIAELTGTREALQPADLITLPGVITLAEPEMDEEALPPLVSRVLSSALEELIAMREREGRALQQDLSAHLEAVAALREQILAQAPQVVSHYQTRLQERLQQLGISEMDPARLAQEVALMADRCAIDEELARLESHILQMRHFFTTSGEIGKKLDFLIQEMNREANTIGSKANDGTIAHLVVELKSEIEKLREQIQNVE